MQLQESLDDDIEAILLDQATLASRIAQIGRCLAADYAGRRPLLVCVLRGAAPFLVDLARAMPIPLEIDFMAVSSYGGSTKTSGVVRILKDLETPITERNVIIVEDVVDSGLTLSYLRDQLQRRGPASLRVCALLRKDNPRLADAEVEYVGFDIPNRFVVGYGLDYGQLYRNLPYIGVLKVGAIQP